MGQDNTISIQVVPTGAALGADARNLDLSGKIDDRVFRDIYKAWNDHLVLRFRDQRLDDNALVTFSRRFGELDMAPTPAPGERMVVTLPEVAARAEGWYEPSDFHSSLQGKYRNDARGVVGECPHCTRA